MIKTMATSRGSGARFEIVDSTFVKRMPIALAEEEVKRTLAGAAIGRDSGLFHVPEILDYDAARGEIRFECLADIEPYRRRLLDLADRQAWVERAARILAAIHNTTDATDTRMVAMHGDFSLDNLVYQAAGDRVALIDWGQAHWIRSPLGPPAWQIDLAIMLISIFLRRPFEADRVPKPNECARCFLQAYAKHGGKTVDMTAFRQQFEVLTHDFLHMPGSALGRLKIRMRFGSLLRAEAFVRRL